MFATREQLLDPDFIPLHGTVRWLELDDGARTKQLQRYSDGSSGVPKGWHPVPLITEKEQRALSNR